MTNPGGASVDTVGMQHAAQRLEGCWSESKSHMQSVNSLMLQLQGSWQGQASQNFAKAMNDWENQFKIIIQELSNVIEKMGKNAKDYDAQEAEAVNLAPSFGGEGLQGL